MRGLRRSTCGLLRDDAWVVVPVETLHTVWPPMLQAVRAPKRDISPPPIVPKSRARRRTRTCGLERASQIMPVILILPNRSASGLSQVRWTERIAGNQRTTICPIALSLPFAPL